MLMAYVDRPSLLHCGIVAKALVSKFEFLADSEGDGEVSLQKAILSYLFYYRVFCVHSLQLQVFQLTI